MDDEERNSTMEKETSRKLNEWEDHVIVNNMETIFLMCNETEESRNKKRGKEENSHHRYIDQNPWIGGKVDGIKDIQGQDSNQETVQTWENFSLEKLYAICSAKVFCNLSPI